MFSFVYELSPEELLLVIFRGGFGRSADLQEGLRPLAKQVSFLDHIPAGFREPLCGQLSQTITLLWHDATLLGEGATCVQEHRKAIAALLEDAKAMAVFKAELGALGKGRSPHGRGEAALTEEQVRAISERLNRPSER